MQTLLTNQKENPKSDKKATLCKENVFATTHIGLIREINEDSYIYCVDENSPNCLFAVADGIGGHESGEIASRLCLKELVSEWRNKEMWNEKSSRKIEYFLLNAVKKANEIIYKQNLSFNIQHPMGTTLVAAIITPRKIVVAHAGDSRLYRYNQESIESLTRDHSFVEELIVRNIITREEAKGHPFSHIISKCVGTSCEITPEVNTFKRKSNDKYFLCSDGLFAHLEDSKLKDIASKSASPQETVRNLLYAALKKGGEDNITILSVFV